MALRSGSPMSIAPRTGRRTAIVRAEVAKSTGPAQVWTQGRQSYDRTVGHVNVIERDGSAYDLGATLIESGICKPWR